MVPTGSKTLRDCQLGGRCRRPDALRRRALRGTLDRYLTDRNASATRRSLISTKLGFPPPPSKLPANAVWPHNSRDRFPQVALKHPPPRGKREFPTALHERVATADQIDAPHQATLDLRADPRILAAPEILRQCAKRVGRARLACVAHRLPANADRGRCNRPPRIRVPVNVTSSVRAACNTGRMTTPVPTGAASSPLPESKVTSASSKVRTASSSGGVRPATNWLSTATVRPNKVPRATRMAIPMREHYLQLGRRHKADSWQYLDSTKRPKNNSLGPAEREGLNDHGWNP